VYKSNYEGIAEPSTQISPHLPDRDESEKTPDKGERSGFCKLLVLDAIYIFEIYVNKFFFIPDMTLLEREKIVTSILHIFDLLGNQKRLDNILKIALK
jgi:hypothetical protein